MKKKKLPGGSLILLVIVAAVTAVVFLFRDQLIINLGIRQYRTIQAAAVICLAVSVIICIAALAAGMKAGKKRSQEAEAARQKEKREKEAVLSVKDKLRSEELLQMFTSYMDHEWDGTLPDRMTETCVQQFKDIRQYREKLHILLENNDAEVLSDTEDMLADVEQHMVLNLRKVINYLSVADPKNASDVNRTNEIMEECIAKNRGHLNQVQDFLYAVTDYLNHQGESGMDINMLEVYKNTILQSIGGKQK